MKLVRWLTAYLLWGILLLLGMWFFVVGREALPVVLGKYYVGESIIRSYQAGFLDRVFILTVGFGWLIMMLLSEELLRKSPSFARTFKVFARFASVELLLVFVADGALVFVGESTNVGWLRWLVLVVELILGVLLAYLGWSKASPWYEKPKSGVVAPPSVDSPGPSQP